MNRLNQIQSHPKTVAFLTLGCKVNSYETTAMEELFTQAGFQLVEFHEPADIYVVNTCTVTNIADRKSRQMLHKARKQKQDAIVVAVGCYVQASKEVLEEDDAIDLVVGNNQKKQIVSIVEQYLVDRTRREFISNSREHTQYEELSIQSVVEKTRAYIKVQDGCNQFCSYCIIPYTRGRVRSRKLEDVITEVEKLSQNGYQEVVLTGIHLSSYGVDQDTDVNLLMLIQAVSKVQGISRIRLGSLEPRIITREFVQALSQLSNFCPHFHLSLQSGCDETLKRMNRHYTSSEYDEKVQLIREYFKHPAITTDVIVGFPGETEEEFQTTKAYLEKVAFSQMHIFKYSKRHGTVAEKMECQVPEQLKNERSNQLIELEHQLRCAYEQQFMNQTEEVLFEEPVEMDGLTYQIGHTKRYLKLAVQSEEDLTNQIKKVRIVGQYNTDILLCEITD